MDLNFGSDTRVNPNIVFETLYYTEPCFFEDGVNIDDLFYIQVAMKFDAVNNHYF